jgi:hypothetical protein
MARDILSDYGPESKSGSRPSNGGQMEKKEIPYSPPKGPTSQMQQGPGLHGDNCGNCGTQGKR